MEKYGPPRDRDRGGGRDQRDSNGRYQDRRSSYDFHSRDDGPSSSNWERREHRPYRDMDDPNRQPTPPDGLPPPLYNSTEMAEDMNWHDSDQRNNRHSSFGRRNSNYHNSDRRRYDRDDGDEGRPRWKGNGRERGGNFNGDRFHERPRGDYGERPRDQGWRSSSNYHNGGGRGEGGGARGSNSYGGAPAGGAAPSGDPWGATPSWSDWKSVGNAGPQPQGSWATTETTTKIGDWGGDGWGLGSSNESNTAPMDTLTAVGTSTAQAEAPATIGDGAGDGWGLGSSNESNITPMDTSTAVGTSAAQAEAPSNDPWATQGAQSWPAPSPPPNNSPPAQSNPWASGWSPQEQLTSTPAPAAPQNPQATGSNPWPTQGVSAVPEVPANLQVSSNQAASNSWAGFRPSPPEPTRGIPASSPHTLGPTQPSMELDSWLPPNPISAAVSSRSTSVDVPPSPTIHANPPQSARSSHPATPQSPARSSPSECRSQSHSRPTSAPGQARRNSLFSKILPHCKRAVEKDPAVPEQLKAAEASSLAVRLSVEKADLLDRLEGPALSLEIENFRAGEKNDVDISPPPVQQSTPIATAPKRPPYPQSTPTVTSERIPGPFSFTSSPPTMADPIPIADTTLQPEAMQLDSDRNSVLARWTCTNKCSRATFAFSFNQSTPDGNSTVVLICRSPAGGAMDPYNEDGSWQVFTTIINRGTEREEVHLLPPLCQSSYRTDQDLSLDITENVIQGQNTVEFKRMMLIGGLAGFTFEVKLVSP